MTPAFWIAFAALGFSIMTTIIGAALYLGRVIGQLDGMMREHVEKHTIRCANYEPNTTPRMRVVGNVTEPAP